MEEHKLARLVEQFTSMRRAAMASAFNVSGTGSNAQNASKAAAIAATLGEEVPDAATLQAARKAAAASAAKTYDVPNIELPIDAAMDEVARIRMDRNNLDYTYSVLVPFLRERLRAIPLQKFKLLSRWAQCCHDSASVERFGPRFTRFLAVLNDGFEDAKNRLNRLTQPVVQARAPDQSSRQATSGGATNRTAQRPAVPTASAGPSFANSTPEEASQFISAVQAAGAAHSSISLLQPPPYAYNLHPLPFATSTLPNPSSGLLLPTPKSKDAEKALVLRSELLIPSDIALYLAWKIDHERATDPFQRLMIKYKWLASSPHIDWIQRSEYMLEHPEFELTGDSIPTTKVLSMRLSSTSPLKKPAVPTSIIELNTREAALPEKKVVSQTETQAKRRAELLFHTMDTVHAPKRLNNASECPHWVGSSAELISRIEDFGSIFRLDHRLSEEQGFPLLFQVEQTFADLFNFQVHFDHPKPYSGADSDNLFAALSAEELADVPEYGQVTISPVRLYLKEATWLLFNKFDIAVPLDEAMRHHHLKANLDIDSTLAAECDLLNCTDVDFISARMKNASEKFHHRAQYFALIMAQINDSTAAADSSPLFSPLPQSPSGKRGGPDLMHNLQSIKTRGLHSPAPLSPTAVPPKSDSATAFAQIQSMAASLKAQLPVHQLRIFFLLRYLRTRMLKQRTLYLLNFFRSIEKKLVFDDWGYAFEDKLQFFSADSDSGSRHKSASATVTPTPLDLNAALPTMPGHSHIDHPAMAVLVSNTNKSDDEQTKSSDAPSASNSQSRPYFQPKVHPTHAAPADFASISDEAFMQFLGIENRDDSVTQSESGETIVCDPWGVPIVYDAALQDMSALMERVLAIGSKLILKERRRREVEFSKVHSVAHLAEQGQLITENVDREQLLCDIMECELQFQLAKCRLIQVYQQAYDHVTSRTAQHALAESILKVIQLKPRLNLDDPYFVKSYRAEISLLRSRAHFLTCVLSSSHSAASWISSSPFAGFGVVLADSDLEHDSAHRKTETLQSSASIVSSAPSRVPSAATPSTPSTQHGLDTIVTSNLHHKTSSDPNPRPHTGTLADLPADHVEDLSEFHSHLADVVLSVESALAAATDKVKRQFLDSASQGAFSAHLHDIAEHADEEDDVDTKFTKHDTDMLETRTGFVKAIGLQLDQCTAVESEYVAIERAVLEAFYFCWQDHMKESSPFTESAHSTHAQVLLDENTFTNADVLNTRLRECEHQFSKADPLLNYKYQFARMISAAAGSVDISTLMSAPTPNVLSGKALTLQLHMNALEYMTLRATVLMTLYECDVLTVTYCQQAKLVGLDDEEPLLDCDPLGDAPRRIYLKNPLENSYPVSRSVFCAAELSRKIPHVPSATNSEDITNTLLNKAASLAAFRASVELQVAHLQILRIAVVHHEKLMSLPSPICKNEKTAPPPATLTGDRIVQAEQSNQRRMLITMPPPLQLSGNSNTLIGSHKAMKQALHTLSTRKRHVKMSGMLHESTFVRLTHIKFPILLSCRQVFLARQDTLRDNQDLSADVKEYFQHELVLDLIHNYSLLLVRAMTFPACISYQAEANSYLREMHFNFPVSMSPLKLLSAAESRRIDPITKERLDPDERVSVAKLRAQIERFRDGKGGVTASLAQQLLNSNQSSDDVSADAEVPQLGVLHMPDYVLALMSEQYGEPVMHALALVPKTDDEDEEDEAELPKEPAPSAALSLGFSNRLINVVRNQMLDESPFDPDADLTGFNYDRLKLDAVLRLSVFDVLKATNFFAQSEHVLQISSFADRIDMESEKALLRSIQRFRQGSLDVIQHNGGSPIKLLAFVNSWRQVLYGQFALFLRLHHETALVQTEDSDRGDRGDRLLAADMMQKLWNNVHSKTFSAFLVTLSQLPSQATMIFLPTLPFTDPNAVIKDDTSIFSAIHSTPAPLAAIDFYQKVHKSDLQSAVKLVGKSIRPDLFHIYASHASLLCGLSIAFPSFQHSGIMSDWPGRERSEVPSQSISEHRIVDSMHGAFHKWLQTAYANFSMCSESWMKELSRDIRIVSQDMDKRMSSEFLTQDSSLRAAIFIEQHVRAAISATQLRDAFFAQVLRRHRPTTASTLPNGQADLLRSHQIFQSQLMPKIRVRVQEASEGYSARQTVEVETTETEPVDEFALDTVSEARLTAQPAHSYVMVLFNSDPIEQVAHADILQREFERLLIIVQSEYVQLRIARFSSEDSLSSTANLISSSSAALAAGLSITWRGQPKLDDASASRKFSFLSHFLAELTSLNTPFEVVQQLRVAESDRQRRYFIVQESEVNAALNRLARNLVDFSKDAVQSRLTPVLLVNNQITHLLHRRERALLHLRRMLRLERDERDRRVHIQLSDAQFALVTELENLRQGLRDVREQLKLQEPVIRERLRHQWERKIESLQEELILIKNSFDAYRVEASNTLLSGLADVRKEQMGNLVDQAAPFNLKRMQLAQVNQDLELTKASARAEELQVMMLRMQAVFVIKEKKLKTSHEAEVAELRGKLAASNKLWATVGELEKKGNTLMEELKLTRMHLEDRDTKVATLERQVDFLRKELKSAGHMQRDQRLMARTANEDRGPSNTQSRALTYDGDASDDNSQLVVAQVQEHQDELSRQQAFYQSKLQKQEAAFRRAMSDEQRIKSGMLDRLKSLEKIVHESSADQERLLTRAQEAEQRASMSELAESRARKENIELKAQLLHMQQLYTNLMTKQGSLSHEHGGQSLDGKATVGVQSVEKISEGTTVPEPPTHDIPITELKVDLIMPHPPASPLPTPSTNTPRPASRFARPSSSVASPSPRLFSFPLCSAVERSKQVETSETAVVPPTVTILEATPRPVEPAHPPATARAPPKAASIVLTPRTAGIPMSPITPRVHTPLGVKTHIPATAPPSKFVTPAPKFAGSSMPLSAQVPVKDLFDDIMSRTRPTKQ